MPLEVATFRTTQQRAKVKRNSATKAGFQPANRSGWAAPCIFNLWTIRRGDERGRDLGDPVGDDVLRVALAADPDGERDRGVEVAAGDVAAREDHDHERGADGERGRGLPAPGGMTVLPTVKTRKKVPMNSTRYFFIGGLRRV